MLSNNCTWSYVLVDFCCTLAVCVGGHTTNSNKCLYQVLVFILFMFSCYKSIPLNLLRLYNCIFIKNAEELINYFHCVWDDLPVYVSIAASDRDQVLEYVSGFFPCYRLQCLIVTRLMNGKGGCN